jgi:hypothetical protein
VSVLPSSESFQIAERSVRPRQDAAYDRRGKIENRSTSSQTPRGLLVHHEGPADVPADQSVEDAKIQVSQRSQLHTSRGVHDDVNTAEGPGGFVKQFGNVVLVGDIRAHTEHFASLANRLRHRGVGLGLVRRVGDDHRDSVTCKTLRAGATDAARPTSDDCDSSLVGLLTRGQESLPQNRVADVFRTLRSSMIVIPREQTDF